MKGCEVKGCDMPATWQLGVKLWARGYARRPGNCARMKAGVVVCDHHKEHPHPVIELFPPSGQDQIRAVFKGLGRAEPDFQTAEWDFYPWDGVSPLLEA